MKLLHDIILAEVVENNKTTKSGIYLGNNSRIEDGIGVVTLVSEKVKSVKVGDKIKYNVNTVKEFTLDGKKTVFVRESEDLILVF